MIYELLSELQPDGYLVLGDTNSCLYDPGMDS